MISPLVAGRTQAIFVPCVVCAAPFFFNHYHRHCRVCYEDNFSTYAKPLDELRELDEMRMNEQMALLDWPPIDEITQGQIRDSRQVEDNQRL